jgi:hypothetical protein
VFASAGCSCWSPDGAAARPDPAAAIAGLLLLIAWSLFDCAGWRRLWRFSRRDFAIAAATFVATVTIRLEIAILLGTILSLLSYLYRTSKPSLKVMGFDTDAPAGRSSSAPTSRRRSASARSSSWCGWRARSISALSPTSRSSCTTCARRWPRPSTCW